MTKETLKKSPLPKAKPEKSLTQNKKVYQPPPKKVEVFKPNTTSLRQTLKNSLKNCKLETPEKLDKT